MLLLGATAVIVAVFVTGTKGEVAVATRLSTAEAPELIGPTFQRPVVLLYVPCDGAAETNVSPAGSRSVTCAAVTFAAPLASRSVIVNVTLVPTPGASLSTVWLIERLVAGSGLRKTEAEGFAVAFAWSAVAVAVTEIGFACVSVATIVSVAELPSLGSTVMPVPLLYGP